MTTIWPVRPWRRAFREHFSLPDLVLGPVECCAFSLLIAVRFGVDMFSLLPCYSWVGSWDLSGESGMWLKNWELKVLLDCDPLPDGKDRGASQEDHSG